MHLLVEYPPTVQISILANSPKPVSIRILGKEFPRYISKFLWKGHLWSPSYFAGSCRGAPLSVISERSMSTLIGQFFRFNY